MQIKNHSLLYTKGIWEKMVSNRKLKQAFYFLSFTFYLLSFTYSQENDAGLWTSVTAEKKITQSFSASFSQTLRLDENISELGNFFSELGMEKKIIKGLGISLNYRWANKRSFNDSYYPRHRYFIDVSYRKKIPGFALIVRTRIQSQLENHFLPSEKFYGNIPENYWRNKISLKYNSLKKYKPFVSAEIWNPLNNRKGYLIDNLRCSGGFEYEMNKQNAFEIYYIYQRELQQKNPRTDYISALSYTFAF